MTTDQIIENLKAVLDPDGIGARVASDPEMRAAADFGIECEALAETLKRASATARFECQQVLKGKPFGTEAQRLTKAAVILSAQRFIARLDGDDAATHDLSVKLVHAVNALAAHVKGRAAAKESEDDGE